MCANINTLSLELLDLIITHLIEIPPTYSDISNASLPPPQNLARYATISRSWQHAIERHTFAAIRTFCGDLPTMRQVFNQSPWRKRYLRALFYSIDLPLYSDDRRFCFERRREHQANLVAFRDGVRQLWAELASWEEDLSLGIRLVLAAEAPMNRGREGDDLPTAVGIGDRRWAFPEHSLTLWDDSGEVSFLPGLCRVTTLEIAKSGRRIYPTAISQMISSLSNLRKLEVAIFPVQPKNKDIRAEMRNDLAHVLESPMLHSLEVLRVQMEEATPYNHNFRTAFEEDPVYPNGDHLCRAVCKLAQRRLRELYLVGPCLISPAIWGLCHDNLDADKLDLTFPHLEIAKIEFALVTYDGRWYYTGDATENIGDEEEANAVRTYSQQELASDSDSDSCSSFNSEYHDEINDYREGCMNGNDPYNTWRRHPDPRTFEPLQRGMILAAMQMPKLRTLELRTRDPGEFDNEVSFQCLAPGVEADDVGWGTQPEEQLRKWRWAVCFSMERLWEVSEAIRQLMLQHLGEEGEIVYFP
ncbi:hypothetical protein BJX68DRAFT_116369 [Aspergillus pseudodeflectus]|uniref:F-box domain-containing protein n=1 Tax=Aspergillus pseudodeflectus TaxID=176178 RepID=A0ABR4L4P8_9EURO